MRKKVWLNRFGRHVKKKSLSLFFLFGLLKRMWRSRQADGQTDRQSDQEEDGKKPEMWNKRPTSGKEGKCCNTPTRTRGLKCERLIAAKQRHKVVTLLSPTSSSSSSFSLLSFCRSHKHHCPSCGVSSHPTFLTFSFPLLSLARPSLALLVWVVAVVLKCSRACCLHSLLSLHLVLHFFWWLCFSLSGLFSCTQDKPGRSWALRCKITCSHRAKPHFGSVGVDVSGRVGASPAAVEQQLVSTGSVCRQIFFNKLQC